MVSSAASVPRKRKSPIQRSYGRGAVEMGESRTTVGPFIGVRRHPPERFISASA